jgi:hypothetical protein
MRSAISTRQTEAEFFSNPGEGNQRRYEALRTYFVDGATAAQAGEQVGLAEGTVAAMVRDFRSGDRAFFLERRPGPKVAPGKAAAHNEVLRLRAEGLSVTDIADMLAESPTPLNRTGVWEILSDEGHQRLAQRPPHQRLRPMRDHPPRVRGIVWPETPIRVATDYAGVMLLLPGLVDLDLTTAVTTARFPGTREVPAISSVLSLLALKMIGRRRVSHVDDVACDPALAVFAGLETLPKATALGTYSYRLARRHDKALLAGLAPAMITTGAAGGTDFDLDFHAIMHYGDDVALETHYVPRRSQRTESVLTLFAQDHTTSNLVYADATVTKTEQAHQVLAFADHWQTATGITPELLVFDSKVTNGAGLDALCDAGLTFLTLRARHPSIITRLEALDDDAWTTITLDRRSRHRKPQIYETIVTVRGCMRPLRQIAVRGLGHDHPTLILTNDTTNQPGWLVNRYAKRMTIEQRLAESIRSFHLDALSSAVALNVDLDTTLTVWAGAAYHLLRRRLTGYHTATPDTIWRRFISTSGYLTITPDGIVAHLKQRAYSPVLRDADLPVTQIPWWNNRTLQYRIT